MHDLDVQDYLQGEYVRVLKNSSPQVPRESEEQSCKLRRSANSR